MRYAKILFYEIVNQRRIVAGVYDYLVKNNIPLDSSDLLRWQWVLVVSALDKYIHDLVLMGMSEEFLGKRTHTNKYNNFTMSMNTFFAIESSPVPVAEFEKEIIRRHSYQSFQDPDKIADALSFIWDEQHKWSVISFNMKNVIKEEDLKIKLRNIVIRRNQIVHEGDCLSASIPLSRQIITQSDTEDVISFIIDLVEAIDKSIV